MILFELHPRNLETNNWIVAIFIFAFFLIAVLKNNFEKQFFEFCRLLLSNKYLKVYRDESQLKTVFNVILFFINLISTTFLIQLLAVHYKYIAKNNGIFFIQIVTFLFVFILIKFLLEKIIGTLSDSEELINVINLHKITYRSYIGALLLPILLILFFNNSLSETFAVPIVLIFLAFNVLIYLILLVKYQNELLGKMFYFILYLCGLEIAPYYFIYYLLTKK